MNLKIVKNLEAKFFEVSYGDGDHKIIYVAKNKKQVKLAEEESCGLEGLDYIKELSQKEITKKIKIGGKTGSFKDQAIEVLAKEGFAFPKTIASAGFN